jgi:hypothetical protein
MNLPCDDPTRNSAPGRRTNTRLCARPCNAERSQSCRQRAVKVVSSWPIFKPGCRAFAVFYFKLLCMVFELQIERFAEPSHSNREGVTIDRLVVSSRRYQEKPSR